MRVRRSFHGTLSPDVFLPFLPLPDENQGGDGGAGGGDGAASAGQGDDASGSNSNGGQQQRTPEQEIEHWKAMARKNEDRAKEAHDWRKANEAKVAEFDKQADANKTEQERALEAAKAEAQKSALAKTVSSVLATSLSVGSNGQISLAEATELAEDVNPARYIGQDGALDMDKVTAWVKRNSKPSGGDSSGSNGSGGMPDLGQGRRGTQPVTGEEAARAQALKRGWKIPAAGA